MPHQDNNRARIEAYMEQLGEPEQVFTDDERDDRFPRVDIVAFERDFSPHEDEEDAGWVLITSGMSDRRMALEPEVSEAGVPPRAELVWYVREPTDELLLTLRWLAQFPFIDDTWLGMGHTVPMPDPVFEDSDLTTFFLLPPIIGRDEAITEDLTIEGDPLQLLVVHVLTQDEYEHHRERGADAILELFDDNDHPFILDPGRESYL